jgi:L-cysteate sulfo-lyase
MPLTDNLARYPLAFLPTPLQPLHRLSRQLGEEGERESAADSALAADGSGAAGALGSRPDGLVNLWIKRDDQTGLAGGGNKTRKLEFLIADALAQGADTIITAGAVQSNHCRQTAAAAAKAGLACHLVLGGQPPQEVNGNLLLDHLLGAILHWTTREQRLETMAGLADDLQAAGKRPYPITYGGSDPVGATGYALAIEEIRDQCAQAHLKPDALVFASSSGGTQAGLLAGAWALGWDVPILGISVDEPEARLQAIVAGLATRTADHIGCPHMFQPCDVRVNAQYLGSGYAVMGALERETITRLARSEGIFLDPVYTARAFGGLLDIVRRGGFAAGQNVIFWHTGGSPALFAYAEELLA